MKTFYLSSNGRINDKSDIEAKMGGDLKHIHKWVFFHNINLTLATNYGPQWDLRVLTCNHNVEGRFINTLCFSICWCSSLWGSLIYLLQLRTSQTRYLGSLLNNIFRVISWRVLWKFCDWIVIKSWIRAYYLVLVFVSLFYQKYHLLRILLFYPILPVFQRWKHL